MNTRLPALRSADLARIHTERQAAVIATLLCDPPDPLPPHCLSLLRYAPESFDDQRYGSIAAAAYNLHLNGKPISLFEVRNALAGVKPPLDDILKLMSISMTLPHGIMEWECEELWSAFSYRRKATLYDEAARAMIASPAQAPSIDRNVRQALTELDLSRNGDGLPAITDASALLSAEMPLPPILIDGLLHQGSKMSLGGGSKTFKSWTFLSIALAVSTGTPWLDFSTTRAKVLILNFEIASAWIRHRLKILCEHAELQPEPGYLDFWNLRGYSAPHATLIPKIIARAKALGYGLIIVDPSYKLIGAGDENSASDVGAMMNSFEQIAVQTSAAVAFGAHFAKGNAAQKEAIDRISGSGVFARDPDSILTFTPHEQPNAFTVEATLRNLPQFDPFVVQWTFPTFQKAPTLDPDDLKKKPGRDKVLPDKDLLDLLTPNPLMSENWFKAAHSEYGICRSTFYKRKATMSDLGLISFSKVTGLWSKT